MALKTVRVNGKELTGFDKFDGTELRAQARRLLAYDDEVHSVEEGGRPDLTVCFGADTVAINWAAPDGFEITRVTTHASGAMAVDLEAEADE
jgi:hypothetical protein